MAGWWIQMVVDSVILCLGSPAEHLSRQIGSIPFRIHIFSLDLLHAKRAMIKHSDLADSSSWEACKLSDEVVMEEGLHCSGWCAFSPTQRLPAARCFPLFSLLWGCIPLAQGLMGNSWSCGGGALPASGPLPPSLSLSLSQSFYVTHMVRQALIP